jgi:ABC-2 type transport system permease protein
MSLIAVERIKLFSTKSPYWCIASCLVASLLFAIILGLADQGGHATPGTATAGLSLARAVFMILAALAATTEYRFSTIKITFLARPVRVQTFLTKTLVVAVLGAVVGFVGAMAAFFLTKALAKHPLLPMSLDGDGWRVVAGWAPVFAISAIIALSVGMLIRQSAGAISIVLLWPLIIEGLFALIPTAGPKIVPWLPFQAGGAFTSGLTDQADGSGPFRFANGDVAHPSPVGGLLLFLGYAVVIWLLALFFLNRRDA